MPTPPRIDRVLETGIYVDDLAAAERFYSETIGLDLLIKERGRHLFYRCGPGMFLVFLRGATTDPMQGPEGGGVIPGHGATGPSHMAFAITPEQVQPWLDRLAAHHVPVESRVIKPDGRGESIYFRDPAGNSIELATPAIWDVV